MKPGSLIEVGDHNMELADVRNEMTAVLGEILTPNTGPSTRELAHKLINWIYVVRAAEDK